MIEKPNYTPTEALAFYNIGELTSKEAQKLAEHWLMSGSDSANTALIATEKDPDEAVLRRFFTAACSDEGAILEGCRHASLIRLRWSFESVLDERSRALEIADAILREKNYLPELDLQSLAELAEAHYEDHAYRADRQRPAYPSRESLENEIRAALEIIAKELSD